jgi:hypothetical protein
MKKKFVKTKEIKELSFQKFTVLKFKNLNSIKGGSGINGNGTDDSVIDIKD